VPRQLDIGALRLVRPRDFVSSNRDHDIGLGPGRFPNRLLGRAAGRSRSAYASLQMRGRTLPSCMAAPAPFFIFWFVMSGQPRPLSSASRSRADVFCFGQSVRAVLAETRIWDEAGVSHGAGVGMRLAPQALLRGWRGARFQRGFGSSISPCAEGSARETQAWSRSQRLRPVVLFGLAIEL